MIYAEESCTCVCQSRFTAPERTLDGPSLSVAGFHRDEVIVKVAKQVIYAEESSTCVCQSRFTAPERTLDGPSLSVAGFHRDEVIVKVAKQVLEGWSVIWVFMPAL